MGKFMKSKQDSAPLGGAKKKDVLKTYAVKRKRRNKGKKKRHMCARVRENKKEITLIFVCEHNNLVFNTRLFSL